MMKTLSGFGVGSKVGFGKALILAKKSLAPTEIAKARSAPSQGIEAEIASFSRARERVAANFRSAREAASDETLAEILGAQLALLEDDELLELVKEEIASGFNAITSTQRSIDGFIELLGDATGEFKERIADLAEIKDRIISAILGIEDNFEIPDHGSWIIVADDLSPLETSKFTGSVSGVITRKGGPTSHTAIVCRQLGIPALVGCSDISFIKEGENVAIDPVSSTAQIGGEMPKSGSESWWSPLPVIDKRIFKLFANVGSVSDARKARSAGAEGVGLLRSELALLHLDSRPSLAEQRDIYREILSEVPKGEVIFRTLDAGTDKPIPFLGLDVEENPALGVRGQRIERIHPEFFQEQLVALKEASQEVEGLTISVMAPMIATREEARAFADQARAVGFESVGVMVEVPALIDHLSELAGVLDFISIGTNDLSQYLFAADRQNSHVAELLDPWQPALLRALSRISMNASQMKVGVCGEAASDPLLAAVLVGLGVTSLSAGVGALAEMSAVANRLTSEDAAAAAGIALEAGDRKRARQEVLRHFKGR